jgi:transcriptional regulator with XRE-family HTH domain
VTESAEAELERLIGANVRRYRAARGLSQADLASALSAQGEQVHQQTILKIEKGTRPLKFAEALRICEALDISPAELTFGEKGAEFNAQQLTNLSAVDHLAQELDDLAERFARLLLRIAIDVATELDAPRNPHATEILEKAQQLFQVNWGKRLNVNIMAELRKQPYPATIRPEFDAPTYGEVLERISQQEPTWVESDGSDT